MIQYMSNKITKEEFAEKYLKEGIGFQTRIKDRLLAFGLKENKCEICGLSEWQGKPLVIQVHHINGNRNDNRLENLQMLCPNCHSQTENYQSKNTHRYNGKDKICLNCGKPFISKYGDHKFCSNECNKLYHIKTQRTKETPYSKEYLQELCNKYNTLDEIGFILHRTKGTVKRYLLVHGLFEDFMRKRNFHTTPVLQYDTDMNFIKEWPCVADAQETLNICHINLVCKGKRKSAGGFFWKYKENDSSFCKKDIQQEVYKNAPDDVTVLQYDIEGNFICEYATVEEASQATNTNKTSIILCLQGKHTQANHYIWKYKNGDIVQHIDSPKIDTITRTPVVMYDIKGNIVNEFPSIKEAASITGVSRSGINQCLRGSTKSAGGYIWKYKNYSKIPLSKEVANRPLPTKIFKTKVAVLQYDLDGYFIKEFETITDAARESGVLPSNIEECIKGKRDRAGIFMWKLKTEDFLLQIAPYKSRPRNAKVILQYDRNGKFVKEYLTMEDAINECNISRCILMKCLSNPNKSYNNYVWRYKKGNGITQEIDISDIIFDSKYNAPVVKCDLFGNILQEYPSVFAASKETGLSRTHINNSIAGHSKQLDNFIWKYK